MKNDKIDKQLITVYTYKYLIGFTL